MGPWSLLLTTVRNVPKQALGLVKGVAKGLFRGVTAPLTVYVVLLGNLYLFYAGLQKVKRARFAASVRLLEDLDEAGVQYLLHHLPAWLQSTEYERAQFLNEANRIMWPAFDTALSSVIRYELLPILRENSPSAISGLSFERLSLGRTPVTILGVKHVGPSFSSRLCFEMDLDVRWAGVPDIVMKLTPSRKWRLRRLDMTPEMHIRLQTIQFSGLMRLALEPLLPDLPFIGGCSISFLSMPELDFDIRVVGGADLMSVPALATWIRSSVLENFFAGLIWPKKMEIPFMDDGDEEEGQLMGPAGLLTVQILEAELPKRVGLKGHSSGASSPYAAVVLTSHCKAAEWDVQAGVTERQTETLAPAWGDTFHLCIAEPSQVLKVFLADDGISGQGKEALPRGRVDVPLTPLVDAKAPKKLMRMGSSAGIAMRARAAARRVRAQVAEAHHESATQHEPSAKQQDSGQPAQHSGSETSSRTGSEPQSSHPDSPHHGAQRNSKGSPHKSPTSKGFLDGSWIEAGDVLGAAPDSPDASSPEESDAQAEDHTAGMRSPDSPTKQAPASGWTLLSSSGSAESQGPSQEGQSGGSGNEQQQPPSKLPPIRTAAAKADDATSSPTSSSSPSCNTSSPRARQPRQGSSLSRARSQGVKVGLARLQSLPAKMARTTATQAALACQEEEGAWLPLLPLQDPSAPRRARRTATAPVAPAKPASSASSEISDVASSNGSDGSKYFPTLTKVNALFDHCADGLVGLFKNKPAASAAASASSSHLKPPASGAASVSPSPAGAFPKPMSSSQSDCMLRSPFQDSSSPQSQSSSRPENGQPTMHDASAGPAHSKPAHSQASSDAPTETIETSGSTQEGSRVSSDTQNEPSSCSDQHSLSGPPADSASEQASDVEQAGAARSARPGSSSPPDQHQSGASQAAPKDPGRNQSGGLPPTTSNLKELLRRTGSSGSPSAQFASFKDWHRATAGYSRPLSMRQTTARRSLFSFLFTADGNVRPGATSAQPASHASSAGDQIHRLAHASTAGDPSGKQEDTAPASSRPSVAGAVRIKLIFRNTERTCKPLSTLPNSPGPSRNQQQAPGSKASPSGMGDQAEIDRQRESESAEQVIAGTPRVMGALVVLLQSITLGGLRLVTPAVVLRLGSQVRRSQACAAMHGGRTEWNLQATFALDLPADPCQIHHRLLLEIGEAPKRQRPAKWAPPASPTAAAWRHELQPTATCTIPLQSILDQGKARGSWKVKFEKEEDKDADGSAALQFGWFPCT